MNISLRKGRRWCWTAAVLSAVSFSFFLFLYAQARAADARVALLLREVALTEARAATVHSRRALAQEIAAAERRLNGALIQKDGVAAFIEFLEKTGSKAGMDVAIDSVEPRERPDVSEAEELLLTLHATGPWKTVLRFAGLMESLPIETRVERITLSRLVKEKTVLWRVDLALSALKIK